MKVCKSLRAANVWFISLHSTHQHATLNSPLTSTESAYHSLLPTHLMHARSMLLSHLTHVRPCPLLTSFLLIHLSLNCKQSSAAYQLIEVSLSLSLSLPSWQFPFAGKLTTRTTQPSLALSFHHDWSRTNKSAPSVLASKQNTIRAAERGAWVERQATNYLCWCACMCVPVCVFVSWSICLNTHGDNKDCEPKTRR